MAEETQAPEADPERAEPQGSGGINAPAPAAPLDADATQGLHFNRLMKHPVTISLGLTLVIGAFVGGTLAVGPLVGLAAAAGAALFVLLIVFVFASNAAEEDFFKAYAEARGLARQSGRGHLPASTPLLRKGDDRYAEQIMDGTLPGGLPGAIALYTYEEETTDSDGNKDTTYYKFTVVMHDLPAVATKVSDLYCQRRVGFRFMDGAEDKFRRMQRLELESDALDRRYEIFYCANDDEVWMKQFFSPKFIVWLTEKPPKDFAFELSAGSLCVNVKGHYDNAADLDTLCEAASEVARRLASEAAE